MAAGGRRPPPRALHDRFGGQANLAVLAADGTPHHYAGNDENPVFAFIWAGSGRVDRHLLARPLAVPFVAPEATDRRLIRSYDCLTRPRWWPAARMRNAIASARRCCPGGRRDGTRRQDARAQTHPDPAT